MKRTDRMDKDTQRTTDAPVSAAPVPVLQDAPEPTEQRVRRWIAENLSQGRIARDVDLWNELQAAVPALITAIDAK